MNTNLSINNQALKSFALFLLLSLFSLNGFGQTTETFNAPGAATFTVPAGVTSITVDAWGAGGAGGGSSTGGLGGSGGGGGAYALNTYAVTPGQVINYTIGAGGIGVRGNGGNGGNTTIFGINARGGTGGQANQGAAGTGGNATGGTTNATGQPGVVGTTIGGDGGDGAAGGAGGLGQENGDGLPGALPGGGGGGAERQGGGSDGGNGGNGQIEITYTVTFAPPNDECAGAQALVVNGDENCVSTTSGTIDGATDSGITSGCGGTDDDDVWYTFQATSASHTIDLLNITGSTTDLYIAVYANDPCVSGDPAVLCSDFENIVVSGFTPGATYFVQVYSWTSLAGQDTVFDICIGTPPPPPSNNTCAGAISLPVNPDFACGAVTPGTIANANASGVAECGGTENDDVWYSFVATSTTHRIELLNVANGTTDLYHAVYDASAGCGGLGVPLLCSDPNTSNITGLTPGNTYYIQVYSWSSALGATSTFDICIGTAPACTAPNTPSGVITFGSVTDTVIDGSFSASVPIPDNYIVLINTTGVAPVLNDTTVYNVGDTVSGATVIDVDANTNFAATGLTQLTTYHFFVFAFNNTDCGGGPLYSNAPSLTASTTTEETTYCTPSSTDPLFYIDDFTTTGGIVDITHNNTGFSTNGYGNFTVFSVWQFPGEDVNFSINHVGGTFQANIWVDWNQDLDFDDPDEQVYNAPFGNVTENGSFTVLNTALPGYYRMRVRSDWSSGNVSACGFDDRSETHDYRIRVRPLNCSRNPIGVVASGDTPTTGTISWTAPAPAPANGYEYIVSLDNTTGTPLDDITGTTAGTTVNLAGLTAGTFYYVFVRAICNSVDFGVWLDTSFNTGCTTSVNTPTICGIIIDEAGNDPLTADPFIADPVGFIDCDSSNITLEANTNMNETTDYIVENIAWPSTAPDFDFAGTNQGLGFSDDLWSAATQSIGFDFNFYGNCYNEILVGANGMITFDLVNNAPGSPHGWTIPNNLPSTTPISLDEYTIYGVMHDLIPSEAAFDAIKARTIGVAPCRQFQVSYHDVPMFSDGTILYTGMIVLHETSNIVEVFIEEKRIDGTWNSGNALVGIQGNNIDNNPGNPANEYSVAPCRNSLDTNWEATNEAWRFTPSGAAMTPLSINWFAASDPATSISTDPTLDVSTADTYSAVLEYDVCGTTVTLQDDIIVTSSSLKTWNGSISTEWTDPNNWTPGIVEPALSDCVLIPNGLVRYPIIDGSYDNAQAGSLTIEDTAELLILAGGTLTVDDEVTVDPGGILELEGVIGASGTTSGGVTTFDSSLTANLVQNDDSATNSGEITLERYVFVRNQDYVYWSSPVEDFNSSSIFNTQYIYNWTPTIYVSPTNQYGNWNSATNTTMEPGLGYIVRGPSGNGSSNILGTWNSVTFTGVPHNGLYQPILKRGGYTGGNVPGNGGPGGDEVTSDDDNWNLLGNPYPSGLDAQAFLLENADANNRIDGVLYLWTHGIQIRRGNSPFFGSFGLSYDEADYLAYNLTGSTGGFNGVVGSGQGFFVLMEDGYGTQNGNQFEGPVTFNNSMRVGSDEMFFRMANPSGNRNTDIERSRIWLGLVQPSEKVSTILLGYAEGATNAKDKMYDAGLMSGSSRKLYSSIEDNDRKFVIQGRALPFDDSDKIHLGVVIDEQGSYAITIEEVDGLFENEDQNIYLEDTYNNFIHDLRLSPYFFNSEVGEFNDRFIIRYTNNSLGIEEFNAATGLTIQAPNNNYIKVKSGNSPIYSVIVYDLLGRALIQKNNINASEFSVETLNYADGAYIVKAVLVDGKQKIQKVVLKR
ncbi:fibronectin type III domain-containing protein [Oceanihabitans sp.]|nr:fibronectin type III domain-containing protein [Oceanihabitans sp.]